MKTLIVGIMLLGCSIVKADVYLEYGESTSVRGTKVHCGYDEPQISYYCTVDSAFDGVFSGRGDTELEARTNALNSCERESRGNGIHCNRNSVTCESN